LFYRLGGIFSLGRKNDASRVVVIPVQRIRAYNAADRALLAARRMMMKQGIFKHTTGGCSNERQK
jgi:hypothetical protein